MNDKSGPRRSVSKTPPPRDPDRRDLLKMAGMALAAVALPSAGVALGEENPQPVGSTKPTVKPLNRFPRMLQEELVTKVREIERAGNLRREALRTKADAEAYVRDVKERIRACFGPFPERTPLNARVTGVLERDLYRIEKVIFESRPSFPVTANLYLPKGHPSPLPGVIAACGHRPLGKSAWENFTYAQGLAQQGYVTLMFDPVGQGERLQYVGEDFKPRWGTSTEEHRRAGNQQQLIGDFLGATMVWDGMRAIDYLLTRPEVDARHIGVTGYSGGGTQTAWLCALDPRVTMAAPCCHLTTFRRNIENELWGDTEQYPPGFLARGLDNSDYIAAFAPKPLLLLGQEWDYFDARGVEENHERMKQLYTLLGAPDNVSLFIGPEHHSFGKANREALYGWFNRAVGRVQASSELVQKKEDPVELQCLRSGQVAELGARNVSSFTRARAAELVQLRPPLQGVDLATAISDTLNLPERRGIPDYRILQPFKDRQYPTRGCGYYAVETEPPILALVYRLCDQYLVSRPPRGQKGALLYVSDLSAELELREESWLKSLIDSESNSAIFACDARGTGDSSPNTSDKDFFDPNGSDFIHAQAGLLLNRPYVGQRTYDVLRVLDWLGNFGHEEIHLVGSGRGAVLAAFAALLTPTVAQVTLRHAPVSFLSIAENEDYTWPVSCFVPGILKKFDLPDCYLALRSKGLKLIDPLNAEMKPVQVRA